MGVVEHDAGASWSCDDQKVKFHPKPVLPSRHGGKGQAISYGSTVPPYAQSSLRQRDGDCEYFFAPTVRCSRVDGGVWGPLLARLGLVKLQGTGALFRGKCSSRS